LEETLFQKGFFQNPFIASPLFQEFFKEGEKVMRTSKKSLIFLIAFIFLLGFGCSQKSGQTRGGGELKKDRVLLSGTVDTNGAPKDGVLITAADIDYIPGSSTSGFYTTQTNSDGYYALSVPPGVYNVAATGRALQKAVRSKVRLLDQTASLDFVLTATGDMTGRITYSQGAMEGTVVFLYGTQFMAVTDQSGAYKISGIPVGTYRMGGVVPADSGVGGGESPFPLKDAVVIEAGQTKDLGTIDGSDINRFASIDYVSPQNIDQGRDPNRPVVIQRRELFNNRSNLFYADPGIYVKFDRPMDTESVIEGETVLIEAPDAFADRNLRWKLEWGHYDYYDLYYDPYYGPYSNSYGQGTSASNRKSRTIALPTGTMGEHGQEIDRLYFSPSACELTITPRDANDDVAGRQMPVGKYVIRITNAVKDKDGNPLYRNYVYAFEVQEVMYPAVGAGDDNHFIPNGVTGIEVGDFISIGATNRIDKSSVDLGADLTITPQPAGKKVTWDEDNEIRIYGLYAENTTYTIELASEVKTIYGDPIVNSFKSVTPAGFSFGPFGQKFTVQFTTAAPKVLAMFPKDDSRENGIHEPVTLVFNTVTDRDSVQKHIHVYNDTNGIDKAVEIPAYQDDDPKELFYRLAWMTDAYIPYPGSTSYNTCIYGNCIDSKCNSAKSDYPDCLQHAGDELILFFPRQYNHVYRVEVDGNAVSFTAREIPAFSGSFRTKVPRLVDQNVDNGEIIDSDMYMNSLMGGLHYRYNVGVDISDANFVLTTDRAEIPEIPMDKGSHSRGGSEFNLYPQSLPCATAFTLTMKNIKADDGSVIPEQTFHFSTESLKILNTEPRQGAVNYYLNPDGTSDVVTIQFNGHLNEGMQQAVETGTEIIGSCYGPDEGEEVEAGTVPPNYPVPMFFWSDWGYGWSRLQIAFTMDPCTNYRIHLNTDPATKALLYDDDQNPDTPDVPFFWMDKDLVFTTMCQYEGGEPPVPELLTNTDPDDGIRTVSLDNRYIYLYFTPPYVSGLDLEILAGEAKTPLGPNDYTVEYPSYPSSTNAYMIGVCINHLLPATRYQVTVKNANVPSDYDSPFHNNLPYTFSFTTQPATIDVTVDNTSGMLTFSASSGYFKASVLQDPDTLSLKPDLSADGAEWKFLRDGKELEGAALSAPAGDTDAGDDYVNTAELHYRKLSQYALIEVQILKPLDRWIFKVQPGVEGKASSSPDVDGPVPELESQFANTPGTWVVNVSPDIILPRLEKVEQAGDSRYDYIRLYFNVAMDADSALDPNHYKISCKDATGETHYLGVLRALDYDCLQDNGWDPNKCDQGGLSSDVPSFLDKDGQVVLKTDPQDVVEYTLTVTGVKSASRKFVISGESGIVSFQGDKYAGQAQSAFIVETMNDIRDVYDNGGNPSQWKVRAEKIAIHFDTPMDENTTVKVVQAGESSDAQIVVSPTDSGGQVQSRFEQDWYDNDTTLVVTCYYEVEPGAGNNPPDPFNIMVSNRCRNASGQELGKTTNFTQHVYRYSLSPSVTAYLDPAHPLDSTYKASLNVYYYSSTSGLTQGLIGDPSRYRLVDPALINAPEGDPNAVLDRDGKPIMVNTIKLNSTIGGYQCLLRLSGYPAPSITDPILVFSDIPNSSLLPSWLPVEVLKDAGYTHLNACRTKVVGDE
jgi:hypothetical protein